MVFKGINFSRGEVQSVLPSGERAPGGSIGSIVLGCSTPGGTASETITYFASVEVSTTQCLEDFAKVRYILDTLPTSAVVSLSISLSF